MGLGLGLCCCGGCTTCGGILDNTAQAIYGGLLVPVVGLFDYQPTTTDYGTHSKLQIHCAVQYDAAFSTAAVHVCHGTIGGAWRVVLRLENGVAPRVTFVTTAGITAPAMSADYIGSIGAEYGAVWECSADGWEQIELRNTGSYKWQMTLCEGVFLAVASSGSSVSVVNLPIPESWCCPNGNNDANGGGNCGEVTTLPATCDLTIGGFADSASAPATMPWSNLNGTITLSKTSETATATIVRANYQSSNITDATGVTYKMTAVIVAPAIGVPSSQCAGSVGIAWVSGVIGSGSDLYQLMNGSSKLLSYAWMPLGCAWGYTGFIGTVSAGGDGTMGRPVLLSW